MFTLRCTTDGSGAISLWLTPEDVPIAATHQCRARGRRTIFLDFDHNNRFVRVHLRNPVTLVCPPSRLDWDFNLIRETDHAYIALGPRGGSLGNGGDSTYEVLDKEYMDGIRLDFNSKDRLTGIEVESASRLLVLA